jgi:sigma-B regulation protein RsbU (phosphoserine phosphatase)
MVIAKGDVPGKQIAFANAGFAGRGFERENKEKGVNVPEQEGKQMDQNAGLFSRAGETQGERLDYAVASMREMSQQTDPQEMNKAYGRRMRRLLPVDGSLSISRRDLSTPEFRVTRSSQWKNEINPWKERDRLPLLRGGLGAELLYGDEPLLFDDLAVPTTDPLFEYLDGFRSVAAIPMYDHGAALNMVLLLRREGRAFPPDQFPEMVWMSNLYGRATHNLVLSDQLKEAYETVDYEMQLVADIQRSLLPAQMPTIPGLGLAAHYQTSSRAGGDYYDFFPLAGGKWGILIADVSGHGTPAAVIMAVTHSLAHTYPGTHLSPGELLDHVNRHLNARYTAKGDTFVTAFYGIYDPAERTLTYSSAGHNPPRLKRCMDGSLASLDGGRGLPLGILPNPGYGQESIEMVQGDQLVLYTDGITEANNRTGEMFGLARLDKVLENCSVGASDLLQAVLEALDEFTAGRPAHDDRTLLVAKVS